MSAEVSWPLVPSSLPKNNMARRDHRPSGVDNSSASATRTDGAVYVDTQNSSRRSKVYANIIKQWQEAAERAIASGPKPRSSHARVLGGQALFTRQRQRSFSSASQQESLSWGNLSRTGDVCETISSTAKSAWREQLFRRKLRRLSGVPMAVLLRQGSYNDSAGLDIEGNNYRVFVTESHLSAESTASAIIAGKLSRSPLPAALSSSSQPPTVAASGSHAEETIAWVAEDVVHNVLESVVEGVGTGTTEGSSKDDNEGVVENSSRCSEGRVGGYGRQEGDGHSNTSELRRKPSKSNCTCINDVGYENASRTAMAVSSSAREGGEESPSHNMASTRAMAIVASETKSTNAGVVENGNAVGRDNGKQLLPAKSLSRGFHLVDLHAVVRNYAEWSHCPPQVEPCFRVGDNRDGVLLALIHALGGRLSCSSKHDITAAWEAVRSVSQQTPSAPVRLLDRHVCRSSSLLRASVSSGVSLFEVDCMDELRRIATARQNASIAAFHASSNRPSLSCDENKRGVKKRKQGVGQTAPDGTAETLIRLSPPARLRWQVPNCACAPDPVTNDGKSSAALEAAFGASADDVVDIVETTTAMITDRTRVNSSTGIVNGRLSDNVAETPAGASTSSNTFMPSVVGLSVDVAAACWDDAVASSAKAEAEVATGRKAPRLATDRVVDGEAVASASLTADIEAVIIYALEVAHRATEASLVMQAATPAVPGDEHTSGKMNNLCNRGGINCRRPASSILCPKPFEFCRLHVTGLGSGGARGEPLAALKTVLSRHLQPAVMRMANNGLNVGGGSSTAGAGVGRGKKHVRSRPIVVSADATEHLVAGGVWSTVASIIGRKDATPSDVADPPTALATDVSSRKPEHNNDAKMESASKRPVAGGKGADSETIGTGSIKGAMYYIDDGCYGSLSGALLRGLPLQPSALSQQASSPSSKDAGFNGSTRSLAFANAGAACTDRVPLRDRAEDIRPPTPPAFSACSTRISPQTSRVPVPNCVPCTVWGPTCDGLDCVSRVTPLPADLQSGRDWLFFPDRGMRAGADASGFNGLKPLDAYYCIRQPDAPPDVSTQEIPR